MWGYQWNGTNDIVVVDCNGISNWMDCNNGMNSLKYFKGFNPLPFHVKNKEIMFFVVWKWRLLTWGDGIDNDGVEIVIVNLKLL